MLDHVVVHRKFPLVIVVCAAIEQFPLRDVFLKWIVHQKFVETSHIVQYLVCLGANGIDFVGDFG